MKRSGQGHLNDPDILQNLRFELLGTVSSGSSVADELGAFWAVSAGELGAKRLAGCLFVLGLPDEGVDEAIESLSGMYQFYTERNTYSLPQPRASSRSTGKIVRKSKRPDLVLAE